MAQRLSANAVVACPPHLKRHLQARLKMVIIEPETRPSKAIKKSGNPVKETCNDQHHGPRALEPDNECNP